MKACERKLDETYENIKEDKAHLQETSEKTKENRGGLQTND